MYSNLTWLDHAVTPERTYKMVTNTDGTVTLTPTGTVIQQGTNMSAANFNNIEMGITDHDLATHIILHLARSLVDRADASEEDIQKLANNLLAEVTAEEHSVTLKGTGNYPLNRVSTTVSLSKSRSSTNYTVEVEATDETGGVGDVIIYDKQKNGFKVAIYGSATIKLKVRGGILV
jgi:UTP:GlnB (protein PII) uridylyltransferase